MGERGRRPALLADTSLRRREERSSGGTRGEESAGARPMGKRFACLQKCKVGEQELKRVSFPTEEEHKLLALLGSGNNATGGPLSGWKFLTLLSGFYPQWKSNDGGNFGYSASEGILTSLVFTPQNTPFKEFWKVIQYHLSDLGRCHSSFCVLSICLLVLWQHLKFEEGESGKSNTSWDAFPAPRGPTPCCCVGFSYFIMLWYFILVVVSSCFTCLYVFVFIVCSEVQQVRACLRSWLQQGVPREQRAETLLQGSRTRGPWANCQDEQGTGEGPCCLQSAGGIRASRGMSGPPPPRWWNT
ncbi:hypothetical protein EYD10_16052 [Varanus komodoensis]|nr:hypothetical protein EYD10_16052 [Varanus komodoensis]